MTTTPSASPVQPASVNAVAQNGDNSPPARVGTADLESALMGALAPAAVKPDEPLPPDTTSGPAADPVAPGDDATGKNPLEPEPSTADGPPEGGAEAGDEDETVLSQTDESDPVKAAVQKVSTGMQRRINKLTAETHLLAETVQKLTQERDEAKQAAESQPAPEVAGTLPGEVAKLKTVGEVKARQTNVQAIVRNANAALVKYPNGTGPVNEAGEPTWRFGDSTLTREQIGDALEGYQAELRPARTPRADRGRGATGPATAADECPHCAGLPATGRPGTSRHQNHP